MPVTKRRSRLETLTVVGCPALDARSFSSSSIIPIRATPSSIPMVAGVAPLSRTTPSTWAASLMFSGNGSPVKTLVEYEPETWWGACRVYIWRSLELQRGCLMKGRLVPPSRLERIC